MHKTLHKKFTENSIYKHTPALAQFGGDDRQPNLITLLREDAKELMQPRKEAIANILKLARSI